MSLNRRDFLKSAALAVAAFKALGLSAAAVPAARPAGTPSGAESVPGSVWTLDSLTDTDEVCDLWGNPRCLVVSNHRLQLRRRRYFQVERRPGGQIVICQDGITALLKTSRSVGQFVTLDSIARERDFPKAMNRGVLEDCGSYWLVLPEQFRVLEVGPAELVETWELRESLSLG